MKTNVSRVIGQLVVMASLFFLFSTNAFAQIRPIIGFKGGVNVDNVRTTPSLGANIGVYGAVEFKDKWAVNLEAFYAERHWQANGSGRTRIAYAEVPVYFSLFFLRKYSTFRPKIVIGPSFNFLVENDIAARNAAGFELAGIVGVGINKDITRDGRMYMFLDGRYMHGFTTIDAEGTARAVTQDNYNKTLRFHIGFGFALGGKKK